MVQTASPAEEPDRNCSPDGSLPAEESVPTEEGTLPEERILSEECMSFAEAARRLPPVRSDKHMAPSTLYRWATKGRRSLSGNTVKLETIRIGGTNCTSMQALHRFFSKLNDRSVAKKTRKQKTADKKVDEAKETLRRRGLL